MAAGAVAGRRRAAGRAPHTLCNQNREMEKTWVPGDIIKALDQPILQLIHLQAFWLHESNITFYN